VRLSVSLSPAWHVAQATESLSNNTLPRAICSAVECP
jgi:hypothetical protein